MHMYGPHMHRRTIIMGMLWVMIRLCSLGFFLGVCKAQGLCWGLGSPR